MAATPFFDLDIAGSADRTRGQAISNKISTMTKTDLVLDDETADVMLNDIRMSRRIKRKSTLGEAAKHFLKKQHKQLRLKIQGAEKTLTHKGAQWEGDWNGPSPRWGNDTNASASHDEETVVANNTNRKKTGSWDFKMAKGGSDFPSFPPACSIEAM